MLLVGFSNEFQSLLRLNADLGGFRRNVFKQEQLQSLISEHIVSAPGDCRDAEQDDVDVVGGYLRSYECRILACSKIFHKKLRLITLQLDDAIRKMTMTAHEKLKSFMHKSGASEAVDNSYSRKTEYTFDVREKRSAKLEIDTSLHMHHIVLDDNMCSSNSIHCRFLVILQPSLGWERFKMGFEPFAVSFQ